MKKNLRLLCLGLAAAATFTASFAQTETNLTDRLKNTDMEQGLRGWAFDGEQLFSKNTKDLSYRPGFYGMGNAVLEAWHGNVEDPLKDGFIAQRLGNLPSGTYVFGAYAGASKQVGGLKEPNRGTIKGVELYANKATVPVATDNPDNNGTNSWAHTAKFNVAVKLTDADYRKGWLEVGLRIATTNANYVVWDNPTLYYFGNMSEAEALDAMAKIDYKATAAIADTVINGTVAKVMSAGIRKQVTEAVEGADTKAVTNATLWDDNAALHYLMGQARKSVSAYATLKNRIKSAKAVMEGEWVSAPDDIAELIAALKQSVATAEAAYAAAEMDTKDVDEMNKELNIAIADIRSDSLYTLNKELSELINGANFPGTPGQKSNLEALYEQVADTLTAYGDRDYYDATPFISLIDKVRKELQDIKGNPAAVKRDNFPINISKEEFANGTKEIQVTDKNGDAQKLKKYTSPIYGFSAPVKSFRIVLNPTEMNFFSLSELAFFTEDGAKIVLTEKNITSNAEHGALNGDPATGKGYDGDSIPGLIDGNVLTWFHSSYGKQPTEKNAAGEDVRVAPRFDVTFPADQNISTFYFEMTSRAGQPGQFPGEVLLDAEAPQRDAMIEQFNTLKGFGVSLAADPGFDNADYSEVIDALIKADELIEKKASETEMAAHKTVLEQAASNYRKTQANADIRLPEEGKKYYIVSAVPGFMEKQNVQKAMTLHSTDTLQSIWWQDLLAKDAKLQQFEFELIKDEYNEHSYESESGVDENGVSWEKIKYHYKMKHSATGLYVDSAVVDNKVRLVEEVDDTVRLQHIGGGQWAITLDDKDGSMLHAGDHRSGTIGGDGQFDGKFGVGSNVIHWGEPNLNSASAWYIFEIEVPLRQLIDGSNLSEYKHFASTNVISLTADKECAFKDLKFYDINANRIALDSVVVEGKTATVYTSKFVVGCSYAFDNKEGVTSILVESALSNLYYLEQAYNKALDAAPIKGTEVGQCADVTAYEAALAAAEELFENGGSDEEVQEAIDALDAAVKGLKINMPENGKYYFLYSANPEFNKLAYRNAIYAEESKCSWGREKMFEMAQYWQFVQATDEQIAAKEIKDLTVPAYFIKNVAEEKYIGSVEGTGQLGLHANEETATLYTVAAIEGGNVAIKIAGGGNGLHTDVNYGTIVHWDANAERSRWTIIEAEFDLTDIDFTQIEDEPKAVVKGTYDLFGRRVVAPTAPGIYIIDGRKKLVK